MTALSLFHRTCLQANAEHEPWVQTAIREAESAARWWREQSDDALWGLMFTPALHRAWMVWSEGYCPSCRQSVPMYNWKHDAFHHPWKMQCPHCGERFPQNDFGAYYRSGLDADGWFDAARADRSLLFNAGHPDPADPQHGFGVDGGDGWSAEGHRWRFIGAYLIYGQWKTLIVGGITRLAAAHVLTGTAEYARKAALLLTRVADVYPHFDHHTQASMYRDVRSHGFVSTWHDACEETREMALAWGWIRDAVIGDAALTDDLCRRSRPFGGDPPPRFAADLQAHIETRIFREAIRQPHKIHSNYPRREICLATLHHLLGSPEDRVAGDRIVEEMLEGATAVDGVTGEKGLAGYSAYVIQGLAIYLAGRERREPGWVAGLLARHPKLALTWRFHLDTWCFESYYPTIGDTLWFGARSDQYVGVPFPGPLPPGPSPFTFLWTLYEATGDPGYVQALYRANGNRVDDLPKDVFHPDPTAFRAAVAAVVAERGATLERGSVDKTEWHLAILRGGAGAHRRAVWLNYDTGGAHAHMNGLNLGLFARGLDLLPDLGYPPVQFGGWDTPESRWYYQTAAHQTVVVDGNNTAQGAIRAGRTTLWGEGRRVRWIRVSGTPVYVDPELSQYERTLILVDVSDTDFYVVDLFRVIGGTDHAKFVHSHYGSVALEGVRLSPADEYGHATRMRNFQTDPVPPLPWSADWTLEDRYGYLPPGTPVHLRYTDLTAGASVSRCEGWINAGSYEVCRPDWVPRLMIRRRQADGVLASTFVSVLEPYGSQRSVIECRRLPVQTRSGAPCGDNAVALELVLADGRRDLLWSNDGEDPLRRLPPEAADGVRIPEWDCETRAELAWVRRGPDGRVQSAALGKGHDLILGETRFHPSDGAAFFESP